MVGYRSWLHFLILINGLQDMFFILFAFSQTLLSREATDSYNARKSEYSQECNNYTLYTGQPIWHLEEETKNGNRNMTNRRQYL